jgi:hypothetical protein
MTAEQKRIAHEEAMRRAILRRNLEEDDESHRTNNFGYLDLYDSQKKQFLDSEVITKEEDQKELAESEARKPAFFRKSTKELSKTAEDEELKDVEPWRMEEYAGHKELQKKLEIDFTDEESLTHEKIIEFYKIPKDK